MTSLLVATNTLEAGTFNRDWGARESLLLLPRYEQVFTFIGVKDQEISVSPVA